MLNRKLVLISAVVVALFLGGCGSSDDAGSGDSGKPEANGGGGTEQIKVFTTEGEQFDPVEREVASEDAAQAAAEALLDVPPERTYIPQGTEVKKVTVDGEGEAQVDLTSEFLGGIPADPEKRNSRQQEAVEGRVAQVTYTLTSLKSVDSVKVKSGGLAVTAPKDRADFAEPAKKPPLPGKEEQYGAKVSGAQSLQQQLADLKYLPQTGVDGVVGYQTQQAVMAFQSMAGLTRDGVAGPMTKAALRTAKTPQPSVKRPKRLMEVRIEKGILLLVRGGKTVRVVHVSAGGPGNETPTGRYEVFRKELQSWSVPFSTWLPYASYFNNGIAFHEYPDVPPYPASHGCVRVPAPEAPMVYRFARMGTKVVVRS